MHAATSINDVRTEPRFYEATLHFAIYDAFCVIYCGVTLSPRTCTIRAFLNQTSSIFTTAQKSDMIGTLDEGSHISGFVPLGSHISGVRTLRHRFTHLLGS